MTEGTLYLDARGLEPPDPMVMALDNLEILKKGQKFIMTLGREPFPLYEKASSMGFEYQTEFYNDGRVEITFTHQGGDSPSP